VLEEKNILLPFALFDTFNYPDDERGDHAICPPWPLTAIIDSAFVNLIDRQLIYRFGEFYSLTNDPSSVHRGRRAMCCSEKMHTAKKIARLMASFPFVRAVILSALFPKGYMDDQSDIDYFIITASGRLWLVRTAMALFRRVFLLNSHKDFCTNYFVGTSTLEIGEKKYFYSR